ncbi:MAG: YggS family pyridoxal phosphate enzyme [Deltaproteobacteria bacterium RIFCSPLOWO2_02_FULL_46_8]|nr:MAG: YggS family pyridoxal phosphate enzyme [Deltaproteobacteria bacterium RIFCSPLOWO2_02_FULL_46_8]
MMELHNVKEAVRQTILRTGRNSKSVRLIAVSKGQSQNKIHEAFEAGQRDFGENYVQELMEKTQGLSLPKIHWHFLGHLQKNKVNKVVNKIAWLHSLDSLELALAINKKSLQPLKCLLEIKLSKETTKTGLTPSVALELIPKLNDLSNIDLCGLMTIPPFDEDPEKSRPYFRELFNLLKEMNQRYLYKTELTELSMGMSHDFEIAIEEGATMVRIGSAIFGERKGK